MLLIQQLLSVVQEILVILKENNCYCVKYVRFVLFLIFYISQSSVATHLRCDVKYDNSFAANFLLSPAVKEFLKSVNISQSYAYGRLLFLTHGV